MVDSIREHTLPPALRRNALVGQDSAEPRCVIVTPVDRARGLWRVTVDGRSVFGPGPRAEALAAGLAHGQQLASPSTHVCVFLTENAGLLTRDHLILEIAATPPQPPAAPVATPAKPRRRR